jgi:hypothetical protein
MDHNWGLEIYWFEIFRISVFVFVYTQWSVQPLFSTWPMKEILTLWWFGGNELVKPKAQCGEPMKWFEHVCICVSVFKTFVGIPVVSRSYWCCCYFFFLYRDDTFFISRVSILLLLTSCGVVKAEMMLEIENQFAGKLINLFCWKCVSNYIRKQCWGILEL